jgi:integrase
MNALSPSHKLRIAPGPQSWYRKLPILGPVLDKALAWFRHHGYAESTMPSRLSRISHLIRWLQGRRGPILQGLTQQDLCSAYDSFRIRCPDVASTTRVLARFFREEQLIPEGTPAPPSASECELKAYGAYLREMRGMADSTIAAHQNHLRFFLKFLKYDQHPIVIHKLRIEQIETFLRQRARTNNRFSLQHVVAALRGFLQQQHAQGALQQPLHRQIDTPRTYRLEQLPRALPWEQVVSLLRSIDRTQPEGQRDFTLLYLAARYGLRSGELVRLTLDDIDWRTGILQIQQTKTKNTLRLPLTDEAGDILARYLKTARPPSSLREVFLRRTAPMGPLTRTAVYDILQDRIRRSGLQLRRVGGHSLRHSLAAHLLRRGVALETISEVLGHQAPESTSVYLRLAVEDLREVGLPVPQDGNAGSLKRKGGNKTLPRVRLPIAKPLSEAGFHSGLATSLHQYLATRRALGRGYANEEAVLRRWDHFVQHEFSRAHRICSEMFHGWAQTMPHLTPTVRRRRLQIVRNFLLFHARNHPQTYIPELTILPRPNPHRPPRLVSAKEMARVLAVARQLPVSPQNPLRAQTIRLALLLLFCCGLRRGELLRLQWCHFDTQENMLRIEATKFHKSRLVPVSKSVAQELQAYQALRRQRNLAVEPEDYLIWSDNPLATKSVYSAPALANNWQQLCLATGVLDERGRPPRIHDLRHSHAVAVLERWYRTGTDLHAKLPHLATYLGHVNPVSTHHYLHLTPELQQAANQRFHDYAFRISTQGGIW